MFLLKIVLAINIVLCLCLIYIYKKERLKKVIPVNILLCCLVSGRINLKIMGFFIAIIWLILISLEKKGIGVYAENK